MGLVTDIKGNFKMGKDSKPYTAINYSNGPAAQIRTDPKERRDLSNIDTTDIEFLQPALNRQR